MLKIPVTEIFILRPATLAVLGGIVVRAIRYVQQMGKHLSSLGLRLEDTRFRLLFQDVKDSITALNNAMIKHMRGQ